MKTKWLFSKIYKTILKILKITYNIKKKSFNLISDHPKNIFNENTYIKNSLNEKTVKCTFMKCFYTLIRLSFKSQNTIHI